MHTHIAKFPSGLCKLHFDATINDFFEFADKAKAIIITDENIANAHGAILDGYKKIVLPAGEVSKTWATVEKAANTLLELGAHRGTILIGFGGGVITDITGFLASVFMRGIDFAFVPTTLLGMVDAAIGGKNGVNIGLQKNLLGVIRQPSYIIFINELLQTLAREEWCNGFAEIIKYGYIADMRIISLLEKHDVTYFQNEPHNLSQLIEGCVLIKIKIVMADEHESGIRKYLNFGHTVGHAFETLYHLPHGYAIGLGMIVALRLSNKYLNLPNDITTQFPDLLSRYGLPVALDYDVEKVLAVIKMDKKKNDNGIEYVLIEKPGVAALRLLTLDEIKTGLA